VLACETLYYLNNIPKAIQEISRVGKSFIISYYHSKKNSMDPIIYKNIKNSKMSEIAFDNQTKWSLVFDKTTIKGNVNF